MNKEELENKLSEIADEFVATLEELDMLEEEETLSMSSNDYEFYASDEWNDFHGDWSIDELTEITNGIEDDSPYDADVRYFVGVQKGVNYIMRKKQ